jgi:elongation factor 1-gamma
MSILLFANPTDTKVKQVQLVSKYAGAQLAQEKGDIKDNKESWNVGNKLPALRTAEGGYWELNAIYRHLARSSKYPLYGKNAHEHSVVDSWVDYAKSDIEPHVAPLANSEGVPVETVYEHVEGVKSAFEALNKHLLTNFYLASNRVTIADLVVVFTIHPLFTNVFDTGFRKAYPNLVRWFETVVNQPKFLEAFGPTVFAAKSSLPPPPKKQPVKKVQGKKKEDGGDDDDKEPQLEEAGKKLDINYLGSLPPSKFNLEAWKTKYANTTPTRPEATNWFWENYDPTGWCVYFYHYKWPEECKIDFMTANKFGGFLQRAEAVKNLAKFSMTSQVTLKKDALFHIWGIWLFRGTTVPPEFMDVDDTEYYDWRKADENVAADRELITDIWAWESQNNWAGNGEFYTGRTWGC